MITNHDIVCVSTSPWSAPYGSRQELMSRLARENRVLYVEYQADWLDPARYPQLRRAAGWHPGRMRRLDERLWVLTPPLGMPGASFSKRINAWNQRRLGRAIQARLRELGFRDILLWAYPPFSAPLIGTLGERLSLYHCIEAFAEERSSNRLARRRLSAYEQALVSRCGVVMACSQRLCQRLGRWRDDVVWMPPGVALDAFTPQLEGESSELDGLPRPLLGYAGSIDRRVDVRLLDAVAQAFPEATLVLIGPVHRDAHVNGLRGRPNVRWLGSQPKARLPALLQRLDVCLIPYRLNAFTSVILPLKLFEYLAMEKPVVSVALPELRPYASAIHLAEDRAGFIAAIRSALTERPATRGERMRLASWDERLEQISQVIEERLARRDRLGRSAVPAPA